MVDRLQAAALGLVRAAEKFDPERGYRFSTYAALWCRQKVGKYVAALPSPAGPNLPGSWTWDDPRRAEFAAPAKPLDSGIQADDGQRSALAEVIEGSLLDLEPMIEAEQLAMAISAMRASDPDAMALLELHHQDGVHQPELAALAGISQARISHLLRDARREFRRLPEVAAALA